MMTEKELLEPRTKKILATPRDIRDWFILRFGRLPEHDKAYYEEWKERFSKYDKTSAWQHMDLESRRYWLKVEAVKASKKKMRSIS